MYHGSESQLSNLAATVKVLLFMEKNFHGTSLWILEFLVLRFSVYKSMGFSFLLGTKFCGLAYPKKTMEIGSPQTIVLPQYNISVYNSIIFPWKKNQLFQKVYPFFLNMLFYNSKIFHFTLYNETNRQNSTYSYFPPEIILVVVTVLITQRKQILYIFALLHSYHPQLFCIYLF